MDIAIFLILFIVLAVLASLAVMVQRRRRSGGVVGIGRNR